MYTAINTPGSGCTRYYNFNKLPNLQSTNTHLELMSLQYTKAMGN